MPLLNYSFPNRALADDAKIVCENLMETLLHDMKDQNTIGQWENIKHGLDKIKAACDGQIADLIDSPAVHFAKACMKEIMFDAGVVNSHHKEEEFYYGDHLLSITAKAEIFLEVNPELDTKEFLEYMCGEQDEFESRFNKMVGFAELQEALGLYFENL